MLCSQSFFIPPKIQNQGNPQIALVRGGGKMKITIYLSKVMERLCRETAKLITTLPLLI